MLRDLAVRKNMCPDDIRVLNLSLIHICVYINKNVLPERIEIKSRDSSGYVTEILADGKVLEGEAFRKGMGLTSSNFTIQKSGKEIRFLCRGKGHGLGFSQYGGNEMAKESANAKEILQYYFPEMDVLNIKSVNC